MSYAVKEVYLTRQGEGFHTGRRAVFLRFSGCNLWTGREQDRARAICTFCDTDFLGTDGPRGDFYRCAKELARVVREVWEEPETPREESACSLTPEYFEGEQPPLVVCTGGEPLLQLNSRLIDALHDEGFEIAVETNGTRRAPDGIDWVCVSPKAGAELNLMSGNELKLVWPQQGASPEEYEPLAFEHFYLQPMDGPEAEANAREAERYCATHPKWKLSRQMHKVWGVA